MTPHGHNKMEKNVKEGFSKILLDLTPTSLNFECLVKQNLFHDVVSR